MHIGLMKEARCERGKPVSKWDLVSLFINFSLLFWVWDWLRTKRGGVFAVIGAWIVDRHFMATRSLLVGRGALGIGVDLRPGFFNCSPS